VALAVAVAAGASHAVAAQDTDAEPSGEGGQPPALIAEGRELYLTGCASCHGEEGQGATDAHGDPRGPSLLESGEAGAYYYLATGRMPLSDSNDQPRRKPPAYDDDEIDALVAFVVTLGDGPPLPEVDIAHANRAEGGELYRLNCAPCHSAAGAGGALSYGQAAPNLHHSAPLEAGAAIRSGPGQMPAFGAETLTEEEVDDVVAYVQYLRHPDDPGGLPLGRIGPIPEGLVAWLVGMSGLLLFVYWIGTRSSSDGPQPGDHG
jgi:ubiquinol-cytochrome c reductase cytochrome c subunit